MLEKKNPRNYKIKSNLIFLPGYILAYTLFLTLPSYAKDFEEYNFPTFLLLTFVS